MEHVKSEDARLKTNPRHKARLLRKQAQAEEYFARKVRNTHFYSSNFSLKEAKEEGLDYDRLQALNWTAEEVAEWQAKEEERKARADQGFTDYNQLAFRKYNRLTSAINPEQIQSLQPDSEEAKANLAADVNKQLATRAKFSKRRHFSGDEDVTFINQRNYRFNQKIARAYDKYTKETKESLERGTAL